MLPDQYEHQCFTDRLRLLCQRTSIGASTIHANKRTNIYNCGQPDSNIYFVEYGRVKRVMFSPDGKVCLLSIHGPAEIFGEACLMRPERHATASAMDDTVLRRIPSTRFLAALSEEGLLEDFIRHLVRLMAAQQQVIMGFVTMDSQRRLAAALLQLGHKFGRRHPEGICLDERITQEELSGMVGTTRSRVGFFLKGFGDTGLVGFGSDGLILLDEERLSDYVGARAELRS
jgi:CRP-like cAMP-binding protein